MHFQPPHNEMKCVFFFIKESYSKEKKVKIFTFAYGQAGGPSPSLTASLTVKYPFFTASQVGVSFIMFWPITRGRQNVPADRILVASLRKQARGKEERWSGNS